jgi:hypothetical protein
MEPNSSEGAEFLALCGANLRFPERIAVGPEVHHFAKAETGKPVILLANQHV